ncbi:MAG: histidine kinase [Bacilli bacterium]|nr:histidine kinase [Bacilli bacterium]
MKFNKLIIYGFLYVVLLVSVGYLTRNKPLLMIGLYVLITIPPLYYFYWINQEYAKMNDVLEKIINNQLEKSHVERFVSNRKFNANLNRLMRNIDKMRLIKEEDQLAIEILTNNITSPIIYIDRDGKIRYVNNQFLNSFEVNLEINDIYEKLRNKTIYKFIDDAFIFETKNIETLIINERYYQANAIPVKNKINNHYTFIGIVFIFHDITELKKYENLQREFLADASHELKTPISAIKGASEILLSGSHPQETIKEFLTIIKEENDRMERIVNDILLLSRLESANLTLNLEKINLSELILSVKNMLNYRLINKNQTLHLDLTENLATTGDYERLKTVFLNLLNNAINYTDENKAIYIKSYYQDNYAVVSIRDEGIGIEEKTLPHIFERFYRVDKARSRITGGTGLGLAIVKSTLDIHNAKIEVKSKVNEGTEFIIYFNKG